MKREPVSHPRAQTGRTRPQPRPGAVAPSCLGPSAVLALQRTAGNRATAERIRGGGRASSSVLARQPGAVASPASDAEFRQAVRERRFFEAAQALNRFAPADVAVPLRTVAEADLDLLRDAADVNGTDDHTRGPIAAESLDRRYRGALRDRRWGEAATHLNGFNVEDIRSRLQALATPDPDGLLELDQAAVAGRLDHVHLVAAPIVASNEPRRIEVFNARYGEAMRTRQWPQVVALLNAASTEDRAAKLAAISSADELVDVRAAAATGSLGAVTAAVDAVLGQEPHATVLRTRRLQADWQATLGPPADWGRACETLRGFNATDIETRLNALSHEQVAEIARMANGPRRAEFGAIAASAERIRVVKLDAAYTAALNTDWVRAATLLNGYNDADLDARLRLLTPAQSVQMLAGARQAAAIGTGDRIVSRLHARTGRAAGAIFGTVTTAQVPEAARPGGNYGFQFRLTFHPDPSVVDATKIGFVQTSRVVEPGTGANKEYMTPQVDRRNARHEAIDRIAGRRSGFYGVNNDGTPAGTISFGRAGPGAPGPAADATFYDRPADAMTPVSFNFETSVVAMEGAQASLVYAVVHWGFDVAASGAMTAHAVRTEDRPTAGFGEAVQAWNAQAAGPAAGRNAPGQQPLPAFR